MSDPIREATDRYLRGEVPSGPCDEGNLFSMIAAHLADVVDEDAFERVYREVYGEPK